MAIQASAAKSAASSPLESGDDVPPVDLAERLNWEEKRKYIKGLTNTYTTL
jgi:cyclin-dependent kinase 7